MNIQLKHSKSVTTLVFYVTESRVAEAKKCLDDLKPILAKHGFPVEEVVESVTKRPE